MDSIHVETKESKTHYNELYSRSNQSWNLDKDDYFIGGAFRVSNLSGGYHGILKQYWNFYLTKKNPNVLLISESDKVKQEFNTFYSEWIIDTIDLYPEINVDKTQPNIVGDICSQTNPLTKKYDLIINQATIEHVYNPFQAMYNLSNALELDGILITHTHPPGFGYHRYPNDYIRFMKDWWYDLPKYIDGIILMELCMSENSHVFTCYKKITKYFF